jgi:selenide,water dikinase
MAAGAGVHPVIDYAQLPFYDGAQAMYEKGQSTGSNKANRALVARYPLVFEKNFSKSQKELLYDPQTSGGLMLALPKEQAPRLLADLHGAGIGIAVKIGEIEAGVPGVTVR